MMRRLFFSFILSIQTFGLMAAPLCSKTLQLNIVSIEDTSMDYIKKFNLDTQTPSYLLVDCQSFLQNIALHSAKQLENDTTPICKPVYVSEEYCIQFWEKIHTKLENNQSAKVNINFEAQKIKVLQEK